MLMQDSLQAEFVDGMARPGLFDSDVEWEEFLADLYGYRRSGPA